MGDDLPQMGRSRVHVTLSLNFGTASLTLERLNELNKKYIKIMPANGENIETRLQNTASAKV